MSTTILFVFAEGCGACSMYKENYHQQTLSLFSKFDVTTEEFTAGTLEGFPTGTVDYPFLEDVTFFPCIICAETKVLQEYKNQSFKGDIFDKLFVWNGTILSHGNKPRIRTINPQLYSLSLSDFEKFYRDFLKKESPSNSMKNNSKVETNYSQETQQNRRMYVCGGIRAVPPRIKK